MRISSTTANPIRTRGGDHEALARSMGRPKRFSNKAVQYGIQNEGTAREELQEKLGTLIFQTGLVVMPQQPWLCCSPDGLMMVDGETVLVEIKCPETCQDCPILDRAESRCNVSYLAYREGDLSLEPPHPYYTQVQVQLYVLNLQKAVFYVYSPKGSESILVKREDGFLAETIPKLEHFYFTYFFPIICK
ncbi:unnamed protein product [Ixodes pacificus]